MEPTQSPQPQSPQPEGPGTEAPKPEWPPPARAGRARSIGTKLGLVSATGLLIGAAAFGLSGVASADSPAAESGGAGADRVVAATRTLSARAADTIDIDVSGDDDVSRDDGASFMIEISPEDEAVLEEFEQCLADAGLDDSAFDDSGLEDGELSGELSEDELEALDAEFDEIFAECEPILEGLSEDVLVDEFDDLSPEDEAVLERFDECLDDVGLNEFTGDDEGEELSDAEIAELEEKFAECDPILDELSEDAGFFSFGDGECDHDDDEEILEEADGSDV